MIDVAQQVEALHENSYSRCAINVFIWKANKITFVTEALILQPLSMTNATNIIAAAELATATDIDSLPGIEAALPESFAESLLPLREKGDEVNSFLLCVLITKAAKRIRIRAENIGVFLPVSSIMRSVMHAYQLAANGKNSPFSESEPDFGILKKLDDAVLKKEVARHAQNNVKR